MGGKWEESCCDFIEVTTCNISERTEKTREESYDSWCPGARFETDTYQNKICKCSRLSFCAVGRCANVVIPIILQIYI